MKKSLISLALIIVIMLGTSCSDPNVNNGKSLSTSTNSYRGELTSFSGSSAISLQNKALSQDGISRKNSLKYHCAILRVDEIIRYLTANFEFDAPSASRLEEMKKYPTLYKEKQLVSTKNEKLQLLKSMDPDIRKGEMRMIAYDTRYDFAIREAALAHISLEVAHSEDLTKAIANPIALDPSECNSIEF